MAQRARFFDSTGVNVTLATSAAADDIIDTTAPHGFIAGQPVHFTALTGGAGLSVGVIYFVTPTSLGSTTFRISATQGGADLGFTTDITAGTVVGGDRVYTSAALAEVVSTMLSDGVASQGNEMAVSESSPAAMSVRVNTGKCFILGYFLEVHTAQETLTIAAAHATLARIDRVVARRDLTGRNALLAVLTGTPASSPVAPALTQNVAGTYEIPLAQVLVPAAAASIVNANITDERGARVRERGLLAELLNASGHRHEGTDTTGRKVRHTDLASIAANDHHAQAHSITGADHTGTLPHSSLSSVTSDQHHAQAHAIGGADHTGSLAHTVLSGVTADQHHARSHNHSNALDGSTLTPAQLQAAILGTTGTFELTDILDAPQITANQNDYNPTGLDTCGVLNISSDAARTITGMVRPGSTAQGRVILLVNTGAFTITLSHNNGASGASARWFCPGAVDFALTRNKGVWIVQDSHWQIIG